ncbi:hypothetical protein [Streptomyces zagrosensis]|uniref:Uncharacterized protein n=1 Tax=Streptomyces zagrosensis TaxID=1042984 RepID=A0A7W9QCU3_9ACTN|nr:hypothetical protein [Streptomyces zagrosensis]MBB5937915.1 hypothetical protein [Streptomyces zagrosensis]
MTERPDHWPPAPEHADTKLAQLLALNDQLATDVPLVEDAATEPAAQPCTTCRAVAIVRDRARALRNWPQYRQAVETLHQHRGAGHQHVNSGRPVISTGKRSLVLTGQHTVRTVQGTVLRFFLADTGSASNASTDASTDTATDADTSRSEPACRWKPATDIDFQHAYENALFDPKALADGELRSNTHRIQLPLDALAGAGGFFWSDGADGAGIMTTNGASPSECGLDHLADIPADPNDAP